MASKKQAKSSKKTNSKQRRTGGDSAKKSTRSSSAPRKKTTKKTARAAAAKKKTKKSTKKPASKASKRREATASKRTKSVAAGGKKSTTKKSAKAGTKKSARKSTTAGVKKTTRTKSSVRSEASDAGTAAKKKSKRKKPVTAAAKKSTSRTTKKSGDASESTAPSSGLRQLSQAVAPGSKPKLKWTSQELHSRAADSEAGAALAPAEGKKPRKRKMSKRELEKYRELLKAKRAELLGDVANMSGGSYEKGSGNLSHTPQHMADHGTDNYDQEFTLGLVEFERRLLNEIDEALQRIEDGTYGICQLLGRPISAARLQAKPWAKYCIEAARQLEQAGRR